MTKQRKTATANTFAKRLLAATVFALAAAAITPPSAAHTDEMLAAKKAPNGGQLKAAGPYHLELVVRGAEIRVFVYDHADNGVDASKLKGSVQLLAGQDRQTVELSASGKPANEMKGVAAKPMSGEVRAVVRVQGAGNPEQARYVLNPK